MGEIINICVSFFILGAATTFLVFQARSYRKERESLAYWDKQYAELWAMVGEAAPVSDADSRLTRLHQATAGLEAVVRGKGE